MTSQLKDIASLVFPRVALAQTGVTAGGANDATAVVGADLQLSNLGVAGARPHALCFLVTVEATLSAGETATLNAKVQTGPTTAYGTDVVADSTVATLAATGSTVVKVHVPVDRLSDHNRLVVTCDLSKATADTAKLHATALFGFPDLGPKT